MIEEFQDSRIMIYSDFSLLDQGEMYNDASAVFSSTSKQRKIIEKVGVVASAFSWRCTK